MSENKQAPKENNKKGSSKPSFNSNWIYALIGIFLIVFLLKDSFTNNNYKKISQNEFIETMFKAHDVDRVVIVNNRDVEV